LFVYAEWLKRRICVAGENNVIDAFTVFGFEMCILLPNFGKFYYVLVYV